MSDKIDLYSFPSNWVEALSILYLQNQNLVGKTPAEIHTMYRETLKQINADYQEKLYTGYEFSK